MKQNQAESMNALKGIIVDGIRLAFSEDRRLYSVHVQSCPLCSAYRKGGIDVDALTKDEAVHLLDPLRGQPRGKSGIRSTLTLLVADSNASKQ